MVLAGEHSAHMTDQAAPFGAGLSHARLVTGLLHCSGQENVEGVAEVLHPDFRVVAIPGLAPARGYRSRDEFLEYFEEAKRAGQLIQPDLRSLRALDNGAILVEGALCVTGENASEIVDAWFVYTFRDGLIASLGNYLDPLSAEEAALAE